MNPMFRFIGLTAVAFIGALAPLQGDAAATESTTTIETIYTYMEYGGDVIVKVPVTASGCADGFWLRAADAGFKSTLAVLLSALHTGSRVRIGAESTNTWPVSTGQFCRVTFAGGLAN